MNNLVEARVLCTPCHISCLALTYLSYLSYLMSYRHIYRCNAAHIYNECCLLQYTRAMTSTDFSFKQFAPSEISFTPS